MTEKTSGSINTRQTITDPDGMEAVERAILQATDKIAALMTALKIQQAVDSDELREKVDELVRAMPEKLKNQGDAWITAERKRTNAKRGKKNSLRRHQLSSGAFAGGGI